MSKSLAVSNAVLIILLVLTLHFGELPIGWNRRHCGVGIKFIVKIMRV